MKRESVCVCVTSETEFRALNISIVTKMERAMVAGVLSLNTAQGTFVPATVPAHREWLVCKSS